jgi:hypothetical protein
MNALKTTLVALAAGTLASGAHAACSGGAFGGTDATGNQCSEYHASWEREVHAAVVVPVASGKMTATQTEQEVTAVQARPAKMSGDATASALAAGKRKAVVAAANVR